MKDVQRPTILKRSIVEIAFVESICLKTGKLLGFPGGFSS